MDFLKLLKKINSNFHEFVCQEIQDEKGNILGTKYFGVEKDSTVFSGGTS